MCSHSAGSRHVKINTLRCCVTIVCYMCIVFFLLDLHSAVNRMVFYSLPWLIFCPRMQIGMASTFVPPWIPTVGEENVLSPGNMMSTLVFTLSGRSNYTSDLVAADRPNGR